jgi:hypothetical protein
MKFTTEPRSGHSTLPRSTYMRGELFNVSPFDLKTWKTKSVQKTYTKGEGLGRRIYKVTLSIHWYKKKDFISLFTPSNSLYHYSYAYYYLQKDSCPEYHFFGTSPVPNKHYTAYYLPPSSPHWREGPYRIGKEASQIQMLGEGEALQKLGLGTLKSVIPQIRVLRLMNKLHVY